jgi:carbon catabolite-derepressing protein kinase
VAEFEEQERDAQLAAMDVSCNRQKSRFMSHVVIQPRNPLSPNAVSPNGGAELEENPFDSEFIEYDEDEDDVLDFSTPQNEFENTFAVLNTSLPDQLPEHHHLASYVTAKRQWPVKEKKQHRTKWHFGIRSRSPPMEVMLEIYRTLKTLGMEWKEKSDLGGLGGVRRGRDRAKIERAREYDGYVDLRAASAIYFIETRARVQDVVVCGRLSEIPVYRLIFIHQVLMNLQLYMVDSINYLVDFHHKKTYKASLDPNAGIFDMAHPDYNLSETASESSRSVKDLIVRDDEVVSPFIFMDVACRLILELAGGGAEQ